MQQGVLKADGLLLLTFLAIILVKGAHFHREVDPLDVGHGGRIRVPWTEFHDPTITTLSLRACGGYVVEEFPNRLFLPQEGRRLPTSMDVAPLSQGDQSFRYRPKSLCLGEGCSNSPFANQGTGQTRQKRFSLAGVPL